MVGFWWFFSFSRSSWRGFCLKTQHFRTNPTFVLQKTVKFDQKIDFALDALLLEAQNVNQAGNWKFFNCFWRYPTAKFKNSMMVHTHNTKVQWHSNKDICTCCVEFIIIHLTECSRMGVQNIFYSFFAKILARSFWQWKWVWKNLLLLLVTTITIHEYPAELTKKFSIQTHTCTLHAIVSPL